MQIHLKPKELSKKLLTESRQRNPKPVCKYSPGQTLQQCLVELCLNINVSTS